MGRRFGRCSIMAIDRRIGRLDSRCLGFVCHRLLHLFFSHRSVMAIGRTMARSIMAIGLRRIRSRGVFSTRIPMSSTLGGMLTFRKCRAVFGRRGMAFAIAVTGSCRIAMPLSWSLSMPFGRRLPMSLSRRFAVSSIRCTMRLGRGFVATQPDHAH